MKTFLVLASLMAVLGFCSAQSAPAKKANAHAAQNDGERLFEMNCGRCHRPPDQLSPRIAGSVLRHMRVRANLSQEDQQKILKYLAP